MNFAVTPLFRWDNYLGLFAAKYGATVENWAFATHGKGAAPQSIPYAAYEPWEFPAAIAELEGSWIFNLDLDYFFSRLGDGKMGRIFTDAYIRDWGMELRKSLDNGIIKLLTVSLSPECAAGWEGAEEALEALAKGLGIDFFFAEIEYSTMK